MFQTRLPFRIISIYMSSRGFSFSFICFVQFILDTEFKNFRSLVEKYFIELSVKL